VGSATEVAQTEVAPGAMAVRRGRRWRVVAGLVAAVAPACLVLVAGCGSDGGGDGRGSRAADVDLVTVDEFAARLADPEAVVVNVHVPYEGEIAGTDLFVPFDEITSSARLPSERDRPLLVYCRTGNMSATATADLAQAGYTNVTDLDGGMIAWAAGGRSIETVPERSSMS
jgi:rhodanese-related sulfurtransferase